MVLAQEDRDVREPLRGEHLHGEAGAVVCVVELVTRGFDRITREPKWIGGEDWIANRALLRGPCSGREQPPTLAGLRADDSKPDVSGEARMVDARAAEPSPGMRDVHHGCRLRRTDALQPDVCGKSGPWWPFTGARIERDRVLLDPRTVDPADDRRVEAALREACAAGGPAGR